MVIYLYHWRFVCSIAIAVGAIAVGRFGKSIAHKLYNKWFDHDIFVCLCRETLFIMIFIFSFAFFFSGATLIIMELI